MRIHDLGPLQVEVDGRLVAVPGRRGSALAALLVHVNRRVSVDLLLDAVWADNTTARSASTLETLIWRLRQLLEPRRRRGEPATVILNDSGGYRLLASGKQADSIRFDQLALDVLDMLSTQQFSRAIHSADEALSLWRAPPFDLLVDRSWAVGPIARLVEVCAQVQERRIGALLGIGRHEQAVVDLELLLSEHPLRERLWAQRMLALHRCGRTDEALRAFHAARALLLDEIGVEPGRQLVEAPTSDSE